MLRIAIASVISPLVFPWIAWPATNSAFRLLAYGQLSWYWDLPNAVLNAQQFFIYGYELMFIIFVPLVLLFRKVHWTAWWVYVTAGVLSGYIGFLLIGLLPSVVTQPGALTEMVNLFKEPNGFINIFWAHPVQHYHLGTTVAAGVMMMCLWIIGVRGNPWLAKQSNPPLNQTRADDARAG